MLRLFPCSKIVQTTPFVSQVSKITTLLSYIQALNPGSLSMAMLPNGRKLGHPWLVVMVNFSCLGAMTPPGLAPVAGLVLLSALPMCAYVLG